MVKLGKLDHPVVYLFSIPFLVDLMFVEFILFRDVHVLYSKLTIEESFGCPGCSYVGKVCVGFILDFVIAFLNYWSD